MPQTIQQALKQASEKIKIVTSQSRLEAEYLLGYVINQDHVFLHANPEKEITKKQLTKYNNIIDQRAKGKPVAYLTGQQEFYGLKFFTKPGVLIPRPESEQLIDLALEQIPENTHWQIADIGTGSGCLAVSLATQRPNCAFLAVDKSVNALAIAKLNIRKYKLSRKIKLIPGNLLAPLLNKKLNLIIANLPYGTPVEIDNEPTIKHEPRMAISGGPDGLNPYRVFLKQLRQRSDHPIVILEIDPRRKIKLGKLIKTKLPDYQTTWKKDLSNRWRFVILKPKSFYTSTKSVIIN
ncbi:peptide chain release factor N(5)-glutamine methyltransferase [Patescibacteria group bacterium]|nr:peptide chain release factor N(5)-glutamine methyltransferase [Patescibacteria group bacterium]